MSHDRISKQAGLQKGPRPVGPTGRPTCRQCGQECPVGRRTFCSKECVDAWKIKTDPGYVRILLFRRDHGVCHHCGLDCDAVRRRLRHLALHPDPSDECSNRYCFDAVRTKPCRCRYCETKRQYPGYRAGQSYWEAHHIVPVSQGGGECGLDGYWTLCRKCHVGETNHLRRIHEGDRDV